MKRILLVAAAAILGAVITLTLRPAASAQQSQQAGRFQLVNARYKVLIATSSPVEESGLFKIDTETGATFIYREGFNKGAAFTLWERIPDPK